MPLTTQTWRVAGPYGIRADTLANRMTDILAAFAANGADSNGLWIDDTSQVSGTDMYIKFKRKGTPGGTLGTFRGILFAFTTATDNICPNVLSTNSNTTLTNNCIFLGCGSNISTTAPTITNICTTLMYTLSTTKFTKGFLLDGSTGNTSGTVSGSIGTMTSMYIIECDTMCAIVIASGAAMEWGVVGECVEKLSDNTGIWCGFGSSGVYGAGLIASESSVGANAAHTRSPFPIFNVLGVNISGLDINRPIGACLDAANSAREVGRMWCGMTHGNNASVLEDAGNALLAPVLLGSKVEGGAATSDYVLLGLARQIRMGPLATGGIKRIFNGTPALRGYIAVPPTGGATQGVVFDNTP